MSASQFGEVAGTHALFDRAVALLTDAVADSYATAARCDAGGWEKLAIERRVEGDYGRLMLISVLADVLVFEGLASGEAGEVAVERADELIAAATARRGETAGAA